MGRSVKTSWIRLKYQLRTGDCKCVNIQDRETSFCKGPEAELSRKDRVLEQKEHGGK